jgi:hypothetical protein
MPVAGLPPVSPLTAHETLVFELPLTVAANCKLWPAAIWEVFGEMDTLVGVDCTSNGLLIK